MITDVNDENALSLVFLLIRMLDNVQHVTIGDVNQYLFGFVSLILRTLVIYRFDNCQRFALRMNGAPMIDAQAKACCGSKTVITSCCTRR